MFNTEKYSHTEKPPPHTKYNWVLSVRSLAAAPHYPTVFFYIAVTPSLTAVLIQHLPFVSATLFFDDCLELDLQGVRCKDRGAGTCRRVKALYHESPCKNHIWQHHGGRKDCQEASADDCWDTRTALNNSRNSGKHQLHVDATSVVRL